MDRLYELHAPFNAFKKGTTIFLKIMLNRLRRTVFVKGGALCFLNVCSSVIFSINALVVI